jgi:hypothetical protein
MQQHSVAGGNEQRTADGRAPNRKVWHRSLESSASGLAPLSFARGQEALNGADPQELFYEAMKAQLAIEADEDRYLKMLQLYHSMDVGMAGEDWLRPGPLPTSLVRRRSERTHQCDETGEICNETVGRVHCPRDHRVP